MLALIGICNVNLLTCKKERKTTLVQLCILELPIYAPDRLLVLSCTHGVVQNINIFYGRDTRCKIHVKQIRSKTIPTYQPRRGVNRVCFQRKGSALHRLCARSTLILSHAQPIGRQRWFKSQPDFWSVKWEIRTLAFKMFLDIWNAIWLYLLRPRYRILLIFPVDLSALH